MPKLTDHELRRLKLRSNAASRLVEACATEADRLDLLAAVVYGSPALDAAADAVIAEQDAARADAARRRLPRRDADREATAA